LSPLAKGDNWAGFSFPQNSAQRFAGASHALNTASAVPVNALNIALFAYYALP
jgi:hypothetical protein